MGVEIESLKLVALGLYSRKFLFRVVFLCLVFSLLLLMSCFFRCFFLSSFLEGVRKRSIVRTGHMVGN